MVLSWYSSCASGGVSLRWSFSIAAAAAAAAATIINVGGRSIITSRGSAPLIIILIVVVVDTAYSFDATSGPKQKRKQPTDLLLAWSTPRPSLSLYLTKM
jgi:hypothetical protein